MCTVYPTILSDLTRNGVHRFKETVSALVSFDAMIDSQLDVPKNVFKGILDQCVVLHSVAARACVRVCKLPEADVVATGQPSRGREAVGTSFWLRPTRVTCKGFPTALLQSNDALGQVL